ncbi:MAG: polysaccharide biosynthesis protein [Paludibacteraceae bacterium]|nr:polysaccharide biosynthesis protein [Paludibacteraceae bacterium]
MGIIARQSIKGTIVTYIGVAVGFLTTFFVLTRFLTAEEIGLARVLLDAATLFIGLAQLGTSSSIIRFFPYFRTPQQSEAHGFFFWTTVIPLLGFICFALLYHACHIPLAAWFSEKSPLFVDYYYAVLPIAFFMLYQTVFETCSNVLMRIVVPRAVREVLVRIGLLVCYLLYAFHVLSLDGFVLALCINYAVAAVVNVVYVFAIGHISLRPDWTFLRTNRPLVRRYLLYTAFLLVSALASVVAPTLSSFFLTAKMGLAYTGVFAIATYMAVMVSIPYRSLTAIASPQLADALKRNEHHEAESLLQQVTGNAFLVGCLVFLLLWLNIDLIYALLPNGTTYAVARREVFILALSQLLLATFSFSVMLLNYSRFYGFSLIFSFVLTALAIVFNNALIPLYGMTGAALSNLLSYAVYCGLVVVTLLCSCRTSPFSRTQLWTLVLFITILVLNHLILWLLPSAAGWWGSLIRTLLFGGGFAALAYRFSFSPQLNALLRSLFVSGH